jgi:hypothetical protein
MKFTKPDVGLLDGSEWEYEYDGITCGGLLEICDEDDLVEDRFLNTSWLVFDTRLFWSEDLPIDQDTADIMGNIIPARTDALGSSAGVGGEITSNAPLNFLSSNHDHSAQFHGYISESRPTDGRVRLLFWENLMEAGFELNIEDYSGLARADGE